MRDVGVHSCGTIRPRRGGRRPGGGAGRRASRNPPRSTSSSRGSPAPASWSSAPCTHTRASHEWGLEECRATSDAWCTTPPWWGTMTCLQHGRDTPWKPVVASTSDFGVGRGESRTDASGRPVGFQIRSRSRSSSAYPERIWTIALRLESSYRTLSHHITAQHLQIHPRRGSVRWRGDATVPAPVCQRGGIDLTIW